jgi:hypothetical protein
VVNVHLGPATAARCTFVITIGANVHVASVAAAICTFSRV